MENMQKISWRIWKEDEFGKVLLIGGILYYIPLVNLLLLGYYGRWVKQLVLGEGMDLPRWNNGRAILEETVRVFVPAVVWGMLPAAVAALLVWGLTGILYFLHLGFFAATIAWFPMAVVALFCPPAVTVALIRIYRSGHWRETFAFPEITQTVVRHLKGALFPLFQFYGILVLGWPLAGFAAFLASLPLLAQLVLVFRHTDEDLKSGAI